MPINNKDNVNIIDAESFKDMMRAALDWLKEQKSFIDSLNVFPVPDGDTGTNMYLTFKEAVSSLEACKKKNVADLSAALSKGALMGARGNSGVILSQLIRGFSQALKNQKEIGVRDLAAALEKASEVAYNGVLKPVEGTILTVSRESAAAAKKEAAAAKDIVELLNLTINEAQESLKRTPELLDALKEAEVVDAGGKGYLTILEGMLKGLQGEKIEYKSAEAKKNKKYSEIAADIKFTYCTQMLIEIKNKKNNLQRLINKIREDMQSYGDSIMVVGNDNIIKIHVHTNHPGVLLEYALKKGKVFDVKIDNMKKQNIEKVIQENNPDFDHKKFHQDPSTAENDNNLDSTQENLENEIKEEKMMVDKNIGIISVANGEGIINILKELGVDFVIRGGQSMNPSTNDFLEAVEKLDSDKIIILPNNKNIISAAKQVAELSKKEISIIESRSIPQAITALMSFDDQLTPKELKEKMESEMKYVKTLEITKAIKDSKVNGMEILEGSYIGIKDGDILINAENEKEAVIKLLNETAAEEELVTIYYGKEAVESEAEEIKKIMEEDFDFDEIEIYSGGQPLYPYIISLE